MEVKLLTKEQIEIKTISFETLRRISDFNLGKLNRNIDVDKVLFFFPQLRDKKVELETIILHHHHMGELTDPHYRCYVKNEEYDFFGIQDIFLFQWLSL